MPSRRASSGPAADRTRGRSACAVIGSSLDRSPPVLGWHAMGWVGHGHRTMLPPKACHGRLVPEGETSPPSCRPTFATRAAPPPAALERRSTSTTSSASEPTRARSPAAFPDPWLRLYSLKANGLPRLVCGHRRGRVRGIRRFGGGAGAGRAGRHRARVASRSRESANRSASYPRRPKPRSVARRCCGSASNPPTRQPRSRPRPGRTGTRLDVLVRVNPQVQPETHGGLAVGAPESKFGVTASELPDVIAAGGGREGPAALARHPAARRLAARRDRRLAIGASARPPAARAAAREPARLRHARRRWRLPGRLRRARVGASGRGLRRGRGRRAGCGSRRTRDRPALRSSRAGPSSQRAAGSSRGFCTSASRDDDRDPRRRHERAHPARPCTAPSTRSCRSPRSDGPVDGADRGQRPCAETRPQWCDGRPDLRVDRPSRQRAAAATSSAATWWPSASPARTHPRCTARTTAGRGLPEVALDDGRLRLLRSRGSARTLP